MEEIDLCKKCMKVRPSRSQTAWTWTASNISDDLVNEQGDTADIGSLFPLESELKMIKSKECHKLVNIDDIKKEPSSKLCYADILLFGGLFFAFVIINWHNSVLRELRNELNTMKSGLNDLQEPIHLENAISSKLKNLEIKECKAIAHECAWDISLGTIPAFWKRLVGSNKPQNDAQLEDVNHDQTTEEQTGPNESDNKATMTPEPVTQGNEYPV